MSRVITFGEIMMRLNPEGYLRFVQAEKFEATYAGGEANVAVSLANYGMDAAFVSKVPAHEIGQCAVNELRRYGVDTSLLLRGGTRLGVYYCEKVRLSAPARSSMTARVPQSQRQVQRSSTGIRFSAEPIGFIGPVSHRRSAVRCRRPAWTPAKRPGKRA